MRIDWLGKLVNLLHTAAFCLAIAALQAIYSPRYDTHLVYSLCIGISMWALIDFGRHAFPSARETGWPQGAGGILLPLGGIVAAYLLGTTLGDRYFGWSSWDQPGNALSTSMLVTALAGMAGTLYFYLRGRGHYLNAQLEQVERQASESRLKLLEAQLEPHMLFNTLANLRALIALDPPRALVMLDHLNAYLRATLAASRASQHALQAEFDRLRDYLELMAVRMGPRLGFSFALPPELAAAQVPTLLLQPLVENAIRHGLEPKVEGGRIELSAQEGPHGRLLLVVRDSGVGLPPTDAATRAPGFGITQVRERLATAYGDQASLDIRAEPGGGTRATITLPR